MQPKRLGQGRVFSPIWVRMGMDALAAWGSVGIDSYLVDQIEPRSAIQATGAAGYVPKRVFSTPITALETGCLSRRTRINGDFLFAIISNCRFVWRRRNRAKPWRVI